jgi:hypothetical protein
MVAAGDNRIDGSVIARQYSFPSLMHDAQRHVAERRLGDDALVSHTPSVHVNVGDAFGIAHVGTANLDYGRRTARLNHAMHISADATPRAIDDSLPSPLAFRLPVSACSFGFMLVCRDDNHREEDMEPSVQIDHVDLDAYSELDSTGYAAAAAGNSAIAAVGPGPGANSAIAAVGPGPGGGGHKHPRAMHTAGALVSWSDLAPAEATAD